jgi:hypothetical protein
MAAAISRLFRMKARPFIASSVPAALRDCVRLLQSAKQKFG